MKEIIFAGLLVMVVMIIGIAMTHENASAGVFHQNTCSQSNAVACILHDQRIPDNG